MYCPVCLDGFDRDSLVDIPYCATCGNSVHRQCLYLYLQHAKESDSRPTCPYCREPWREAEEMVKHGNTCACCTQSLTKNQFITEQFSGKRFCFTCFVSLDKSTYKFGPREIISKLQSLPNVQTSRQFILQHLAYREITNSDY